MNRHLFRAGSWRGVFFLVLSAVLGGLPGCSPRGDHGVRLVLSTAELLPSTTFELRFNEAMVLSEEVGLEAGVSPLVIDPPIDGTFSWLSQRSGVFTPKAPPRLDQSYRLSLRPGLRTAKGRPLSALLDRRLRTPSLEVVRHQARYDVPSGISPRPALELAFNAEVAADASFFEYRGGGGERAAAEVEELRGYYVSGADVMWWNGFPEGSAEDAAAYHNPESRRALLVTPAEPLTGGVDWRLVLRKGLPALSFGARIQEEKEFRIGVVTPMTVRSATALNQLHSGRAVAVNFSIAPLEGILETNLNRWIALYPPVPDLRVTVRGSRLVLAGDFELRRKYELFIHAGLRGFDGRTLAGGFKQTLEFEPLPAGVYFPGFDMVQLSAGRRELELLALNVPRVRLRAKRLDEHTLIYALRGYRDHWKWEPGESEEKQQTGVNYDLIPGWTSFVTDFAIESEEDQSERVTLSWDAILGTRPAGAFFIEALGELEREERPGAQALVQLTDLGLVWKRSNEGTLVWVFSHSTGRPLRDVRVRVVTEENRLLKELITGGTGVVELPLLVEGRWLVAQLEDDLHAIPFGSGEGELSRHGFGVPVEWRESRSTEVMLFSDRSVYRPGETVHLKALGRRFGLDGWLFPSTNEVVLECVDARGGRFFGTNLTASAVASVDVSIPLPRSVVGSYRATLRWGGGEETHYFEVAEYETAAFVVAVGGPPAFGSTEKVAIPVSARYHMGRGLSAGKVRWSIEVSEAGFSPLGFEEYQFCNRLPERHAGELGVRRTVERLEGGTRLSRDAAVVLEPDLDVSMLTPGPRLMNVTVEVTDLTQQTISRNVSMVRHTSEFYLGAKWGADLVRANTPVRLEAVAVRPDGRAHAEAVEVELSLTRLEWLNTRVLGAGGRVSYQHELRSEPILERKFALTGEQPELRFPRAGEYLVELWARDGNGDEVITSVLVHVAGEEQTAWDYRNSRDLQMVPDRERYQPGETATVLIKTPMEGAALVTVERDHVRRSFVVELRGNAPAVEIPIKEGDAPNVFVSVVLLRGTVESPRVVKQPEYRLGYCQINVRDPSTELKVVVQAAREDYQPGETVEAVVTVSDVEGEPQPGAEVTLYAVDEGVLSLTGYQVPDPHGVFYAPRPLAVNCGISLVHLFPEDPEHVSFSNKGFVVGGGGESDRLRQNFVASAFWKAAARADEAGRVRAAFTAPDGLTRYRIMAVAHGGADRFGSGQSGFRIHKPFMLEPVLPRFANVGDGIRLRAVLHNQTAAAGEASVRLRLDEVVGKGSVSRSIALAAGASATVEFDVTFERAGPAVWIWEGRFQPGVGEGGRAAVDSVRSAIEVGFPAPKLREIHQSRVERPQVDLLAEANPQLLEGNGQIEVRVSNSRVVWALEAAEQLLHYPYGCVEQTSSSLLPWLVLRGFGGALPLTRSSEQMDLAIRAGVDRLLTMQTRSGGLAYWPGSASPMFWGSAYGGMTLALAERSGVPVPERSLIQLMDYLRSELRRDRNRDRFESCLALYALSLAKQGEPAYEEMFFRQRNTLSPQCRVLLALAMLERDGKADVSELLKSRRGEAVPGSSLFDSDGREAGIFLLGWSRFRPEAPEVERAMELLLTQRRGGHWMTTQGNAWALLGMAEYVRRVEGTREPVRGSFSWRGAGLPFELGAGVLVVERRFEFDSGEPAPTLKLLNPDGATLETQVRLEVHPRVAEQPRQDRGFAIRRAYARLDEEGEPGTMDGLEVGDSVLVTLDIDVREPADYVVVDDALPAILEAVHPEFITQQAAAGSFGQSWFSDFRELRTDRALFFRNRLEAGRYRIRYLARVRSAGVAMAPATKMEEMYRPDRFGLSEAVRVRSSEVKL